MTIEEAQKEIDKEFKENIDHDKECLKPYWLVDFTAFYSRLFYTVFHREDLLQNKKIDGYDVT